MDKKSKKCSPKNTFLMLIPKFVYSLPAIAHLRISGIKVYGLGDISALIIHKGKIKSRIKGGSGCAIGKRVTIKASLTMEENVYIDDECYILIGPVFIGRGTNFMFRSEIVGSVSIGRFCAIARNSVFQAENHLMKRPSIQRGLYSKILQEKLPSSQRGGIIIGNDVWIGTRTIILAGVHVGDGAIVGAGSVVTKDVEPYSIVAGVPAVHKKWRFSEQVRQDLLNIKWWEWDLKKMKRNKKFFMTDFTKVENVEKLVEE